MTDILPKNPHASYNLINLIDNEFELARLEGWQQCQDETMKALRPILSSALLALELYQNPKGETTTYERRTVIEIQEALRKILEEVPS